MRHLAALVLAGCLAAGGCSLLSDGSEPSASPTTPVTSLSPTAWVRAEAADVVDGGTLRLAVPTLPANLNPWQSDGAGPDLLRLLSPTAGSAIRIGTDGGWTVDPDYAESVKLVDEDPLRVEVNLNQRAVWQGGTPITSADMVAFWKAMNGSDDAYEVGSTTGWDTIAAVEPGDDDFSYTVEFERPTGDWPQYVYPRLPAKVTATPESFNRDLRNRVPSSNGPFVVSAVNRSAGIVTQVRNPRWWGSPPRLDKIVWRIADPVTQAKAYVADELDVVDLDTSNYDIAQGTGSIQRASGLEWTQLTLNGGRGPLADVKVRRAVARAIDREALAARAARPLGAPPVVLGSLVLLPGQRGYRDSSGKLARDQVAAEQLLREAGYVRAADGRQTRDGKPLVLRMPVPAETPANAERARLITRDLAAVGITVQSETVPADQFFDERVVPLDFDLVTFARRGSAFPVAAAKPLYYPVDSGQNYTGVEDDGLGGAWDKGIAALDDAERFRVVGVLDRRLFRDVPVLPLGVVPVVTAVRDRIVNIGAAQFEQVDWTVVGQRRAGRG